MQIITITGNVGQDAQLRQTQGGDDVCSFSVGVKQGWGERASTNWFRVSYWGKRGRSTHPYLLKGQKVTVAGEFSLSEYQGKPQLEIRADYVELGGSRGEQRQDGGEQSSAPIHNADLDDDVPF